MSEVSAPRVCARVSADGTWRSDAGATRCALGRGGVRPAEDKREGDGASPAGQWPLRRVLWRPDRIARPRSFLPARPIGSDDGWCDDPSDVAYNRPVRLPYPARCETLMRDDGLYDLVVVLGHNDDPPRAGFGSAIFLHVARPDFAPTDGCVALPRELLRLWLEGVRPGDLLCIDAAPAS